MICNWIFIFCTLHLLIPPMRKKKLPWLKSFSDVLNFLGLLNVANFSRMGLPSGNASRGRFCKKNHAKWVICRYIPLHNDSMIDWHERWLRFTLRNFAWTAHVKEQFDNHENIKRKSNLIVNFAKHISVEFLEMMKIESLICINLKDTNKHVGASITELYWSCLSKRVMTLR